MYQSKKLFINVIVMTGSALLLRFVGVSFQIYLSNRIGAAGIGLFSLISSAHMLAVTFAVSGIRLATIRLISEEMGLNARPNALKWCLAHALFFGICAANVLYFSSNFIADCWIGDIRAAKSLRILSFTLPLISVSAVFSGGSVASGHAAMNSISMIAEQVMKVVITVLILVRIDINDIEKACAAIVTGSVAGESSSLAIQLVMHFLFKQPHNHLRKPLRSPLHRLLSISIPLAVSAYVRCSLSTLEHMLIPRCLRQSGLSAESALHDYGLINGMVFPIITFPLAFFSVYAELIMPEVTQAQVSGNNSRIRTITIRSLRLSLFFSILVSAILFIFAYPIGETLYSSSAAGYYIRIFAPLMPVMYLDTVTDGLLKGLGEHLASMRYNIADALISVILVVTLLPRYATYAYVALIYFTECFNFTLSIHRLSKVVPPGNVSSARDDIRWLCKLFK